MARPLAPDELAALLRDTTRAEAKAAPVSARAVIARGLVAGCGAILLAGGGLWMLAAPGEIVANWGLTTGVIVAGLTMLAGSVPAEKVAPLLLTVRRIQQVQATVTAAEFRKRKAYEAVEELEAQTAARIAELEKTLNHMRAQYKVLQAENGQLRGLLNPQSATYTAAEPDDPDALEKARFILERWFTTLHTDADGKRRGEWFSRPAAERSLWSQQQHAAAVALLKRAGLVTARGKFYEVLPSYSSLPAALHALDAYYDSKSQEPVMPQPARYVELE